MARRTTPRGASSGGTRGRTATAAAAPRRTAATRSITRLRNHEQPELINPCISMRSALLVVVILCGVASPSSASGIQHGRVVSVADGDTLTLLVGKQQIKVRLADIDAPERRQAYGTRSRQSLAQLCHGKAAVLETRNHDRYGRTIGTVKCAGADANAEQVVRGMAWVFDRYARQDSPLYALQRKARTATRGLWADPHAIPPWEFRRTRRK